MEKSFGQEIREYGKRFYAKLAIIGGSILAAFTIIALVFRRERKHGEVIGRVQERLSRIDEQVRNNDAEALKRDALKHAREVNKRNR